MKYSLMCFLALYFFGAIEAKENSSTTVNYHITMQCMPSEELKALEDTIPPPDYQSSNKEEWSFTTINELQHIIALIESGNFAQAHVNFGSNNKQNIDFSHLQSATMPLHFYCEDCEEISELKEISKRLKEKKNITYSEWSTNTIQGMHSLQMLLLKQQVRPDHLEDTHVGDPSLVEVTCMFEIKGPSSEEFQNLLEVIPDADTKYANYQDWRVSMANIMQKLEMLIISGKINRGIADIHVK